ncbi:MAG: beta-hexosaminidase, partial [Mesorhizobium sp.]
MTESKSMILGCAGKSLTREEINFYRNECPWGFILFARIAATRSRICSVSA